MKSLSASLVTLAVFVAGVAAQDFMINTPSPPTQCVPTRFSWSGGQAPYFLAISPGGVPGAAALQQYPNLTGTEFTWSTNISAGTSIGLTLTDASGLTAQSAPVTIQNGPNSDCLNGQSSPSPSGGSTPSASGSTPTTTTTSQTSGGSPTSGSGVTRSPSSSSSSSSSTTAPPTGAAGGNGALSNVASMGLVGVLGVVAAALLA